MKLCSEYGKGDNEVPTHRNLFNNSGLDHHIILLAPTLFFS